VLTIKPEAAGAPGAALERPLSECSHDAARRYASKVVQTAIFGRQSFTIGPSRTTGYAALMMPGFADRILPYAVICHGSFDRKHAAAVVGYNQVEWLGRIRIRQLAIRCHGVSRPSATTGASTSCP
jgi:hypothetical protein